MFVMALRLALRSLLRNRMRSALTALGVIIGVAALLVTVVLGEGTRKMVAAQIATMGSAILMIVPGASAQGGFMGGTGSGRPLQRDDVEAIFFKRDRSVTPFPSIAPSPKLSAPISTGRRRCSERRPNMRRCATGRSVAGDFTSAENDTAAKVCVLGQTVAQNLFGDTDPVGQQIRVKQMLCEIIGVLTPKVSRRWAVIRTIF